MSWKAHIFTFLIALMFVGLLGWALAGWPELHQVCNGPFPNHEYEPGDVAIVVNTEEKVRILAKYILIAGPCSRRKYGEYKVRFEDGSEVDVSWQNLQPIAK